MGRSGPRLVKSAPTSPRRAASRARDGLRVGPERRGAAGRDGRGGRGRGRAAVLAAPMADDHPLVGRPERFLRALARRARRAAFEEGGKTRGARAVLEGVRRPVCKDVVQYDIRRRSPSEIIRKLLPLFRLDLRPRARATMLVDGLIVGRRRRREDGARAADPLPARCRDAIEIGRAGARSGGHRGAGRPRRTELEIGERLLFTSRRGASTRGLDTKFDQLPGPRTGSSPRARAPVSDESRARCC